jgi:D-cysteine desulfhydrase
VYAAGGTLGTAVGLAVGFAAAGARTTLVAPRVTPKTVANEAVVAGLARETIALLRALDASFPDLARADLRLELREEFFEPGYAEASDEVEAAVARARSGGLKLETTYTGKAFAALLADAAAGRLAKKSVVFWDTYNSAPLPAPGPVLELPEALRDYVAECERQFGSI